MRQSHKNNDEKQNINFKKCMINQIIQKETSRKKKLNKIDVKHEETSISIKLEDDYLRKEKYI